MKKLDNKGRLLISRDLLKLVKFKPPCDLLLIKNENTNSFYLIQADSSHRFGKRIACKLHMDTKGRIFFKSFMMSIGKDCFSTSFVICAVLAEDGNDRIEIELVP